jgi:sporulation protein YlmC with PRC-barrel domain
MDAQQLEGMSVVTLAEAERVGRVREVLFEAAPFRARALRLQTEDGQRLIALSDVRSVGPDAIVADDREAARLSEPQLDRIEMQGLSQLTRLKVVDETGSLVGVVARVDIDAETGDVGAVEVTKRSALGIGAETTTLSPDQIESVGSELMTIRRLTPIGHGSRAEPG